MPNLSGTTQQSLAQLLDREATHSVIESLYLRFDVEPMPAGSNANKLAKSTHLVREVGKRASGGATLMSLINYVGSDAFGRAAFRRGSAPSRDLYDSLDRDLAAQVEGDQSTDVESSAQPTAAAERRFSRPGTTAESKAEKAPNENRYVFVVRGRDQAAYDALTAFLKALDLRVVTWDEAVRGAGGGTPATIDVVRAGIEMANAVVVLMTPDDLGQVKPEFGNPRDDPREAVLSGQVRQNVVFEAGWAMAINQGGVILVRVGDARPMSDIDGLNYVWLTNDISSRRQIIRRLQNCGLAVETDDDAWRDAGRFPDA